MLMLNRNRLHNLPDELAKLKLLKQLKVPPSSTPLSVCMHATYVRAHERSMA